MQLYDTHPTISFERLRSLVSSVVWRRQSGIHHHRPVEELKRIFGTGTPQAINSSGRRSSTGHSTSSAKIVVDAGGSQTLNEAFSRQPCHCARCLTIPWEKLLTCSLDHSLDRGIYEYEIGPVAYIPWTRETCSCRLALELCGMALPDHTFTRLKQSRAILFLRSEKTPFDLFQTQPKAAIPSQVLRVVLAAEKWSPDIREAQAHLSQSYFWWQSPKHGGQPTTPMQADVQTQRHTEPLPQAEVAIQAGNDLARASTVDYGKISRWLGKCVDEHGSTCEESQITQDTLTLTLINVQTRALEHFHNFVKFAALSYVWGNDCDFDFRRCQSRKVLPRHLCRTVQDALHVAQSLEIPYLWVDKYCVNHWDKEEAQSQIKQMDRVYRAAFLTIFALSGTSCESGIHGVSIPLLPVPTASTSGRPATIWGSEFFKTRSQVDSSPWKERAWTLQEAAMSRRRLGFLESSVFFECVSELFLDHLDACLGGLTYQPQLKLDGIGYQTNILRSEWSQAKYARLIEEFTTRKLTRQTDAINAIQGLFSHLEKTKGLQFYWGHPKKDFVYTLLWHPVEPAPDTDDYATTRPGFPTFSWSCSTGGVLYPLKIEAIHHTSDGHRLLRVKSAVVLPFSATRYSEGFNVEENDRAVTEEFCAGKQAAIKLRTKIITGRDDVKYALLAEWASPECKTLPMRKASLPDKRNRWLSVESESVTNDAVDYGALDGRVVHALEVSSNGKGNFIRKGFRSFSAGYWESQGPREEVIELV